MIIHTCFNNQSLHGYKSSILKSIFAVLHIARICKTAIVDQPNNVIKRTAFSIDFLVIISLGLISFFIRIYKTLNQLSIFKILQIN